MPINLSSEDKDLCSHAGVEGKVLLPVTSSESVLERNDATEADFLNCVFPNKKGK